MTRAHRAAGMRKRILTSCGKRNDEAIQRFHIRAMDCFVEAVIGRAFARLVGSQ
jgi:hypothetical protein